MSKIFQITQNFKTILVFKSRSGESGTLQNVRAAIDEWQRRLKKCIKVKIGYFEYQCFLYFKC